MSRIEKLKEEVAALYQAKHGGRADWADWMYEGHVIPVAEASREVALRFGGSAELAEAAALLYDIADAVIKRDDPHHESKSMEIARELLTKTGFDSDEIAIVVDDAIAKHSCHGDIRPQTREGKAMAAGDAVVHLTTDFYFFAENKKKQHESSEEISAWLLPKMERDFTNKIAFDELREEVRPNYERLKSHFQ